MLTAKQEKFCQAIADGRYQQDAYRLAYNASGMQDGTVATKASLMIQKDEIRERIFELRAQLSESFLWSRKQSVLALREIVEAKESATAVVAAVKELNAMFGYNAPTKHEIDMMNGGTIMPTEIRIVGVSADGKETEITPEDLGW